MPPINDNPKMYIDAKRATSRSTPPPKLLSSSPMFAVTIRPMAVKAVMVIVRTTVIIPAIATIVAIDGLRPGSCIPPTKPPIAGLSGPVMKWIMGGRMHSKATPTPMNAARHISPQL